MYCAICRGEVSDTAEFCSSCGISLTQVISVAPLAKTTWWRWLLVLPAAVLGYFIAQLVVLLPGIWLPDRASQLVSAFVTPVGFIILGTWVIPNKRTHVALALAVIMLVFHGMFLGVTLFSGWYGSGEATFLSIAYLLGIVGSVIGFYIAKGGNIRYKVGVALLSILAISGHVVPFVIFLGIVVGVWWPIIQVIIESPMWALLLIPFGFIISGFARWIQTLIFGLLMFPLTALTAWLLQEEEAPTLQGLQEPPVPSAFDSTTYYERGRTSYEAGQYEKAIECFDQALELDPEFADAYTFRGLAYYKQWYLDEAIDDYDKAVSLNPQDYYSRHNRGLAYYHQGRYEDAIEDQNIAIEVDPQSVSAYTFRGLAYYYLGRYAEAISDFKKAIDLDPQSYDGYWNRGLAHYELAQYEEAIEDFNMAIHLDPRSDYAYHNRGLAYYNLGRYEEAIADYSEELKLDPRYAEGYTARGLAYDKLGHPDLADIDFQKAKDLAGD